MKRVLVGLAFGLFTLASSAAAQAPAGQAPKGLEEAKALTQVAEVNFKLGHFEDALANYAAAYQKYPTPALLLNIGQCHRMLKNYEQAIFFYKGYLRDKPDAPNRPVIEGMIADATKSLDAQRAEAAAKELERRQAEEQARAALPPPTAGAPTTLAAATSTKVSFGRRVPGIIVTGVGLATLGTAIYFGLHSSSDSSTLEGRANATTKQAWTPDDQSLYNDGKTSAQVATALYVAGGVVVAAGGVLALLGWPKKASESGTTASVAPVPGGAAVLVRGVF